jgi:anti-sigma regulatory factor (Ser/Thr protein kinase)
MSALLGAAASTGAWPAPGRGVPARGVGAVMDGGLAVLGRITIPGEAHEVATARAYLRGLLKGAPYADTAILLASELITNAVLHSLSGHADGTITVTAFALPGGVRVEVADDGGPAVPVPREAADLATEGRGLQLVAALATRWACHRAGVGTVTWFEAAT